MSTIRHPAQATRRQSQQLATAAASLTGLTPRQVIELCEARITMREQESQTALQIIEIYEACQYKENDPREDEILQIIYEYHLTATERGYRWTGESYTKGEKTFGREWVKQQIQTTLGDKRHDQTTANPA